MKLRNILSLAIIAIIITIVPTQAQDEISFGISVNTNPQLRPNDTAIIYAKGINNGEVTFNLNISLLDSGGLEVTIYPEHIEDVAPNEQFFVRITFSTNQSTTATFRVKVEFLAYTPPEVTGVGASLSTSLIINFSVYVSPNANTTIEEQPPGFYIPTTTPTTTTPTKLPIVEIAVGTLVVIAFIVILMLWLKRGRKHV